MVRPAAVVSCLLLVACEGAFGTPAANRFQARGTVGGVAPGEQQQAILAGPPTRATVARRLSRDEFARTIHRLFGADAPIDVTLLPADNLTPFDNDVLEQSPSMALVESTESIVTTLAAWVT